MDTQGASSSRQTALRQSGKWAPLLFGTLALLWGFTQISPRHVFTNDAMMRYLQSESILRYGSPAIHHELGELDAELRYFPLKTGNYLARQPDGSWQPVFPLAYAWFGAALFSFGERAAGPLANGLIFLGYLLVLARAWRLAWPSLLAAVVSTPLLMHAVDFSEAMPTLLLSASGACLMLRARQQGRYWQSFVGAALAAAVFAFRPEALFWPMALGALQSIDGFWNRVRGSLLHTLAAFSGAVAMLTAIAIFHFFSSGSILGTKISGALELEHLFNLQQRGAIVQSMLIGASKLGEFQPGFFGHSPFLVLIFAPALIPTLRKRSRPVFLSSVAALLALILILISAPHDGQWSWGSRYLLSLLTPALVAVDLCVLQIYEEGQRRRPWLQGALTLALAASLVWGSWQLRRGISIMRGATHTMRNYDRLCRSAAGELALFDNPTAALLWGPCVLRFHDFLLERAADAPLLLGELKRRYPGMELTYFRAPYLEGALAAEGRPRPADETQRIEALLRRQFIFVARRADVDTQSFVLTFRIPR
ncbi:MAG: hypothetical protein K1X75_06760 [Leptospirales bacterium]|nr:hypothetical protein [Leptospirales bacterium]